MSDIRDRRLLTRIASGDERALGQLYDRHVALLAARLRQSGASISEAEDALQEAFVAVWRAAATYRGEGPVGAWLWGIASRKLIDLYRSSARSRNGDEATGVMAGRPSTETEWAALIDTQDAVNRLPDPLRQALVAVAWEGLSIADAAVRLGVAEGTIKSRVHRARQILLEEKP
jgi:RNA polymerase sigma-70 factor (ECF subfamily)